MEMVLEGLSSVFPQWSGRYSTRHVITVYGAHRAVYRRWSEFSPKLLCCGFGVRSQRRMRSDPVASFRGNRRSPVPL